MSKFTCLLVVVLLFAAPLACSYGAGKAPPPPKGPKVGDKITDFELKNLEGTSVKTEDARKDKVLVLVFGTTWGPPCEKQVPELLKVQKEYGDKVVVVGVYVKDTADKVKAYNEKLTVTYPTLMDSDGAIGLEYGARRFPTVIVADKDGKITYRGGSTDFAKLKKAIDALLPTPPAEQPKEQPKDKPND